MKLSLSKNPSLAAMRSAFNNESGVALVIGLMFVAILTMLGTTAVVLTTTDMKIGANYKTSVQAFNVAQAGIDEALYRLRMVDDVGNPPPYGSMININGVTFNAAIGVDPNGLLTNGVDDDGNGAVDDISDLNYNATWDNRDWKTKIMLKTSDDTDTTTTFFTPTIQPSASWMEYSSSTDDGNVLTIEFLKDDKDMDSDGNYDEIVFYDPTLLAYNVEGLGGNHASGKPAVMITSTGKEQGSMKRIKVAATCMPVDLTAKASVMVNMSPTITGSALISGFNHMLNTTVADEKDGPKWHLMDGTAGESVFDINGIDNHGGKEIPAVGLSPDYDVSLAVANEELNFEARIPYGQKLHTTGHAPGVWTPLGVGTILPDSEVFGGCGTGGSPADPACFWKEEFTFTWMSLADLLGINQPILDKILEEANVTYADVDGSGQLSVAPMGVTYIDNLGKLDLKLSSTGQGLMYITGNLIVQSLDFKGLIYVEGNANITGGFWLLGAMAIKGTTTGNFSAGNGTFLYSLDSLNTYVNAAMGWQTLWWDSLD